MQYKDGGGVYLGPNNRFDSGSLTGEYLYPLPKSMEDQANVEVEKGEYVTQPGEAPMEAMGQKHADGGTPVSLLMNLYATLFDSATFIKKPC